MVERTPICPIHHSTAAATCVGGFAAERRAVRAGEIDRQLRAPGSQQQWRRSSKCGQCHVYGLTMLQALLSLSLFLIPFCSPCIHASSSAALRPPTPTAAEFTSGSGTCSVRRIQSSNFQILIANTTRDLASNYFHDAKVFPSTYCTNASTE